MNSKGYLLRRDFYKTVNKYKLRYPFKCFSFVLNRTNGIEDYLAEIYTHGIEFCGNHESPSQASTPVVKTERIEDSILIELAKESSYHGAGNRQHDVLQKYFLEHDPKTIAVEVPLYLEASKTPNKIAWGGYLDLLRLLPDRVQLGDFKPNAHREKTAGTQLKRYMIMFSHATGVPMEYLEGVYFDDKNAYQII